MKKILKLFFVFLFAITGQLHAIPVVAAVLTTFVGGALSSGLAAQGAALLSWTQLAGLALVNGVLAGASMLLGKTQPPSSVAQMSSRNVTNDSPIAPRDIVYGKVRKGGTIIFKHKTGSSGEFLHEVIVVAGHVLKAIPNMYLGNRKIIFDGSGNATTSQEVFQLIKQPQIGEITASMQTNWQYPNGSYTVTFSDGSTKFASFINSSPLITWTGGLTVTMDAAISVANPSIDPKYTDGGNVFLKAKIHLGDQIVVDPDLNSAAPDVWDSSHVGFGIAYVYLRFQFSNTVFPNGIDNISFDVIGKSILDTRTNTTAYSNNPAMCLRDYLCDPTYGLGVDPSAIDTTSLNEAANICDEQVLKADGTYENRFTCNYVTNSSVNPESIIGDIRTSFGGICVSTGGLYIFRAAAWRTPESIGLSEADLRGQFTLQINLSRRDTFNTITGVFVSPANNYQATNYTTLSSSTYISQDGGILSKDYPLPATDSDTMCQRLAKIELLKTRLPNSFVLPCKLYALRYQVGDVVPVSLAQFGGLAKNMEITAMSIVAESDSGGEYLGVDITGRETDISIYDWSTSDEQSARLTPATNLPSSKIVPPPTNFTVTSGTDDLYIKTDGTVISRAHLRWTPAARASVLSGGTYEIEFKKSSDANFTNAGNPSGSSSEFFINIDDGVKYDFNIRSVSILGFPSPWVSITNYTIIGKTQPPPTPTGLLVVRQSSGIRTFTWNPVTNTPDLAGYLIRYSTNLSDTWASMIPLNSGILVSSPWETNQLARGTYLFAISSIDTSGNLSSTANYITATLGDPQIAGVVATFYPAPTWAGTLTNCSIDNNGFLVANSSTAWSTLTSGWSAYTDWFFSGAASPITYQSNALDLGVITTFTPLITPTCVGTPTVTVSYSTDNITFTSFAAITGAITARYIKVKVQVAGSTPILQSLAILCDASPVTETILNVNTASIHTSIGDFRAPITKTYSVIQNVNVVFVGAYVGYTFNVIDFNVSTGPRIKIYDGSNSLADAIVNITIDGV